MEPKKIEVEAITETIKTPEGSILLVLSVFYDPNTLRIIDVSYKGAHS
jgi:hypothetical protein